MGEKRRRAILRHFKTVEALKAANLQDIEAVPGLPKAVAESVYRFISETQQPPEDASGGGKGGE